jgi:hypothetical protein
VKQPICDIRERTMGLCSSNWKDPIHDIWGNILSANLTFSSLPTVPFVVVAFAMWFFNCAVFNYFIYAKM